MHHIIGQKLFHAYICLHSAFRISKKLKTYTMLRHALRVDCLIYGVIDGLPLYYYSNWIVDPRNYQTLISFSFQIQLVGIYQYTLT